MPAQSSLAQRLNPLHQLRRLFMYIKTNFWKNGGFKSKRNILYIIIFVYALYIFCKEQGWLPKKSVKGKHVFLTGAGSGLGRLVAIRLAKRGAHLSLVDMNEKTVQQTKRMIKSQAGSDENVLAITCDLANRRQVSQAAQQAESRFGPVDILINNAGVVQGKNVLDMNETLASKTMVVNAECHFWTVKEFLPSMVERNSGHVVSIASMAGLASYPGLADYNASKYAAYGFNEALRLEMKLLKKKIACTTICPSFIDTGMFRGVKCSKLLPMLNQYRVAERIIQAILQEEGEVTLPWWCGVAAHLTKGLVPSSVSDWVCWLVTGFDGMQHNFRGRTGPDAPILKTMKTSAQPYENDEERIQARKSLES